MKATALRGMPRAHLKVFGSLALGSVRMEGKGEEKGHVLNRSNHPCRSFSGGLVPLCREWRPNVYTL